MRSIKVDQYEFEEFGGEESLEIDISQQSWFPHPDVKSFVGSTVGVVAAFCLGEPIPFYQNANRLLVSEYLKRFASIDVPVHSDWSTYELENESWDQVHLVICVPGVFIRYQWSTCA